MTEVTIVMTTWIPEGQQGKERLKAEERCLLSWREHLIHNEAIHLHIADDGSSESDYAQLRNIAWAEWDRGNFTFSQQQRKGVGASLNAGLKQAFHRSPIVLHAVDDWELLADLDITPWVNFLCDTKYDVGAVRFFPHPDLTGTIRHIPPHGWAVDLDKHHYMFATRPSLWHERFFNVLGYFKEGISAIECEADFNERVCGYPHYKGQGVWLALPEMWRPVETGSLSEIMPS